MVVFVIYFNASDFPDKYVVRKFTGVLADAKPLIIAGSLEEARAVIPKWAVRLSRMNEDDPIIQEVWL